MSDAHRTAVEPDVPSDARARGFDPASYDRVLRVARLLASSRNTDEVLHLIIDALRDVLRAERASVFQYDPASHELFATQAHGLSRDLRLDADLGIIGESARTQSIVNISDAYADTRFNPEVDRITGFRTRCMLTIPLLDFDRKLVGVAQVLNKSLDFGGTFSLEDEALAQTLADLAAVALKRALLVEDQRRKEKLEADFDVARRIQQAALPTALPALTGYDIAGHSLAAEQTAGDSFDVIALPPPNGSPAEHARAFVFMADATGHGIGPALSVTQVLSMVRMACRLGANTDDIARHINSQLHIDLPMGRFVTAFFGILDVNRNAIDYVSTGQAPIICISPDPGGQWIADNRCATAMPLGIDGSLDWDAPELIHMKPGSVFVLLSDGYYEAAAPSGEQFGSDRMIECIKQNRDKTAKEILRAVHDTVDAFCAGAPRLDDQTGVIIKRTN